MGRAGAGFLGMLALVSSLGCCCPAGMFQRPIVMPPPVVIPPVVVQQPPPPQPPAPPQAGPRTFDLLPIIDPALDVVDGQGKWRMQGNTLVCAEGNFVPRVQVPYMPPEEYDFAVTFAQQGVRNGVSLIMPKPGGGMFFWAIGGDNGSAFSFAADPAAKEGRLPGLIQRDVKYVTSVQVRRNGVKGLLNGKQLIEHRTNYNDLRSDNWRQMKNDRLLGIACDDPTSFFRITIVEVTGNGKAAR